MSDANQNYVIPPESKIGHVHLKISDLNKSLKFYTGLLGFKLKQKFGEEAAFIAAGKYHHHIGLNTWHSKNGPQPAKNSVGLFHTAIVYPSRKDLAEILQRLLNANYPLTGAADHGVSQAIYLDDPDGNGVELYWDYPESQWPKNNNGALAMFTKPLDLEGLLSELEEV
ncbi:VOC family protein [Planktosalinus lacus]|uniref:Glyoxalase n=1 Tax=Planktosalinus lacus TaxID=1526573 RepID=A0A8J2Y9C7_9FLAO|nr:VOC family protein [Planktosalinus lacus]GGD91634.1 glyoxalase [Planktosalinus lacus]